MDWSHIKVSLSHIFPFVFEAAKKSNLSFTLQEYISDPYGSMGQDSSLRKQVSALIYLLSAGILDPSKHLREHVASHFADFKSTCK